MRVAASVVFVWLSPLSSGYYLGGTLTPRTEFGRSSTIVDRLGSNTTVWVEFCFLSELLNVSSIPDPKRDFEEIYSRNPMNISMPYYVVLKLMHYCNKYHTHPYTHSCSREKLSRSANNIASEGTKRPPLRTVGGV